MLISANVYYCLHVSLLFHFLKHIFCKYMHCLSCLQIYMLHESVTIWYDTNGCHYAIYTWITLCIIIYDTKVQFSQ